MINHISAYYLYTMQFSEDNLYVTEYIGEYHSTWILSSKNVDFVEVKFHAIASEPIHTAYGRSKV